MPSCSLSEKYQFKVTDSGNKLYKVKGSSIELPPTYIVTSILGQGSYGQVVEARNTKTDEVFAIKRCGNLFQNLEDSKRVLREIKLLKFLNHRNLLGIVDIFPPNKEEFTDIYIVTNCMDSDLLSIIKSQSLENSHIKYITYQILRGLKYIHSASVLHRDLKPANILINFDCRVKIADFGLARGTISNDCPELTSYVVTRWYRAPELLLDNVHYGEGVDIWSVGCILAEMVRGKVLFDGQSTLDQVHKVLYGVGIPNDDTLDWVESQKARDYLNCRRYEKENRFPRQTLSSLMPADMKPSLYGLLIQTLNFTPKRRPSAQTLLNHPYFMDIHRPSSCETAPQPFTWEWEEKQPDLPTMRKLFKDEATSLHNEKKSKYELLVSKKSITVLVAAALLASVVAPTERSGSETTSPCVVVDENQTDDAVPDTFAEEIRSQTYCEDDQLDSSLVSCDSY